MAAPARSQPPAKTTVEAQPTHRFPPEAFTPEELEIMDQIDPVDPKAALAWLNGEGPDPWVDGSS